jgi:DNA-binding transcriptional ArsR family regulator
MFADRLLYTFRAFTYHMPILVISEWLSPSTRERLEQQGVNYLDLTDNALIRLDNPALFIRSAGAARAPRSTSRGQVRLRGPKAARVVRLLLDVKPPYGLGDLALASDVAVSYVSRLLDSLSAGGAIERSRRGRVETVDIPRLLRRWADVYDVFATNEASTFLAPQGARECLERLRRAGVAKAAPTLLTAYAQDVDAIAHDLGLLPADHGSNVVLLRPYDSVVWDRTTIENGLAYVSTSQAAIDCLTGNGRMPAEGEALVEWMVANESVWRLRSLAEVAPAGGLR